MHACIRMAWHGARPWRRKKRQLNTPIKAKRTPKNGQTSRGARFPKHSISSCQCHPLTLTHTSHLFQHNRSTPLNNTNSSSYHHNQPFYRGSTMYLQYSSALTPRRQTKFGPSHMYQLVEMLFPSSFYIL